MSAKFPRGGEQDLFFSSKSNISKPKNPNQNIFLKFACVFINAVIGWHFNILNVIGQIIFPSSTLRETDQ